jgi:outer membrane immunogenic protein
MGLILVTLAIGASGFGAEGVHMMRRYSFALLAASVLSLVGSQVTSAADLARRAPPPAPAYVPPAPPPYLWTGCYAGGNIGGAWSNFEITDAATGGTVPTSNNGFAGGGQIGCDNQWNAWVFGFRNMFDGASLSSSRAFADTSTHWFDTLTARGVW